MSWADNEPRRLELSYGLDGLSAREELLFKSFVRLLSHRTHQGWTFSPLPQGHSNTFQPDLMVIAESKFKALPPSSRHDTKNMLVVGHVNRHLPGHLCLPLNPGELEAALNMLGAAIVAKIIKTPNQPEPIAVVVRSVVHPPSPLQEDMHEPLKLLRWPSAKLLNSQERIKLASLMTGRLFTLAAIEVRSGQTAEICIDFVHDLERAGMISHVRTAQAQKIEPPVPRTSPPIAPSLLARIRHRLGLQKARSASANA